MLYQLAPRSNVAFLSMSWRLDWRAQVVKMRSSLLALWSASTFRVEDVRSKVLHISTVVLTPVSKNSNRPCEPEGHPHGGEQDDDKF